MPFRAATALLALALAVPGQSPLTTLFAANNSLGTDSMVWFDLTANLPVSIRGLEVNCSCAANTAGTVEVWTTPGTWLGNTGSAALWTLLGSAPAVAAGIDTATPVQFATPLQLPVGSRGVAIAYRGGLAPAYTDGTGQNQAFATAELQLLAGGAGALFAPTPFAPRVWNGSIAYDLGPGIATATAYGQGCYERTLAVYESFAATAFDLGSPATNTILLQPDGQGGYTAQIGSGNWHVPFGPDLNLGDDSVSAPQALPFAFDAPGGRTNAVWVGANGRLWFSGAFDTDWQPSVAGLLGAGPSLCPLWNDLNPSLAGSITAEPDVATGGFVVSWVGVPQYGAPQHPNTFQVELLPSGAVELRWQVCSSTNPLLVGLSEGLGAGDPGPRDLSQLPWSTGPRLHALQLASTARPVLNTTLQLRSTRVPAAATIGVTVFGLAYYDPGLSLAAFGMPGCAQYTGFDTMVLGIPQAGLLTCPVTVPNLAALAGQSVRAQGVAFVPGVNAAGLLVSNGVDLHFERN